MNANKAGYVLKLGETIIGLIAIKVVVEEYGGVNKVPIILDLLKAANNSQGMYRST